VTIKVGDTPDVAPGAVGTGREGTVEVDVRSALVVGALEAVALSSPESSSPHPDAVTAAARSTARTPVRSAVGPE